MKNKNKRYLAMGLVFTITATTLGNSVPVFANNYTNSMINTTSPLEEKKILDSFDASFIIDNTTLKEYGLSEAEILKFNNYILSDIYIKNGILSSYDVEDPILTRGKFTTAVKAIRKAYNKLPKKVKQIIAKYTKLSVLLNLIEHYTGTLENAIYNACRQVGMPKNIANFVTKTIMLFVF